MMNDGPREARCEGYARMMSHRGGYPERKSSRVNWGQKKFTEKIQRDNTEARILSYIDKVYRSIRHAHSCPISMFINTDAIIPSAHQPLPELQHPTCQRAPGKHRSGMTIRALYFLSVTCTMYLLIGASTCRLWYMVCTFSNLCPLIRQKGLRLS